MTNIQVGSIAAFHLNETLQTGMIISLEQPYAKVLSSDSEILRLSFSRFCLLSATVFGLSDPSPSQRLNDFNTKFKNFLLQLDPEVIIRNFPETGEPLMWEEYQALLKDPDDVQLFAHYFFLRSHPELFSWKKDTIRLRDPEERLIYDHKIEQRTHREAFLRNSAPYIEAILKGTEPSRIQDNDQYTLSRDLQAYLLHNEALDLIKLIAHTVDDSPLEEKIRKIRLALNDIDQDTDPALADSGLPVKFPPLSQTTVDPVLPYLDIPGIFSIDDQDSEDFDDAVSFVTTASGFQFGIHISAVSCSIPLQSPLFGEALNRVSSLYLTPGVTPLFPEQLSTGKLSLIEGEIKPSLSLFVDTDRDYHIVGHRFELSSLRIAQNRSYRDIDRDVHLSPVREFAAFSRSLAKDRENAARVLDRGYTHFLKLRSGKLSMRRIDHQAPSRVLVEEIMVLFNRLFAQFALEHDLPLIFRNVNKIPVNADTNGYTATQAYLSTQADFHPGIGSSAYVHATSPIRRVTDLINQYQFISLLRHETAPFSRADLDRLIPDIENRLLHQREIIHASERYWMLRYLEQEHLHVPLSGVIIKHSRQGVLVELTEWQKRVLVKTESRAQAGREIQLVITSVDPEKGFAVGDIVC